MNVVKAATSHVNVAYGLVLEAWVVEGAAAEARGAAVAVAQDIVGAQAMVEGATAHGIGLPGSEVTADHHRLAVRGVSAGLHRLPARGVSAGLHRLPARGVSEGHHHLPVSGAIAGPLHSHPSVRSPHMPITREHLVPHMLEELGDPQFVSINVFCMTIGLPCGRVLLR